MRSLFSIFVLCVLFVFGVQPGFATASAQADTPAPTDPIAPVESPFIDVNAAGNQLLTAIYGIVLGGVSTFAAGGLVTASTAFLKRLPFLQGVRADTISFALSTLIWGGGAIASYFGFQADFKRVVDFLIILIPAAVGLIGTPIAASAIHERAAKAAGGGGYIGYKRTPELAVVEAIPASALAPIVPISPAPGYAFSGNLTPLSEEQLKQVDDRLKEYLKAAGWNEFNWSPGGGSSG